MKTRRLTVAHWNSTVLGCTSRRLWDDLVWNGKEHVDKGYGDHWQYMHVPAWNSADGPFPEELRNCTDMDKWFNLNGVRYRVRCRFGPGDRYKGETVKSVRCEKVGDKWTWLVESK